MTSATTTAEEQPAAVRRSRPFIPRARRASKSFLLTLVATILVALFLAPMLQSAALSLKTREQSTELGAPLWPADPQTFSYQGRDYDVYIVPIDGVSRPLALIVPGRTISQFVDPASPELGKISWEGSWRSLPRAWTFAPHLENFAKVWDLLD